jgi:hypothetical protein
VLSDWLVRLRYLIECGTEAAELQLLGDLLIADI